MDAYQNLPADERRRIDEEAEAAMIGYHIRTGSDHGLGFGSAIRLLGCVGVLMAKKGYVTST